MSDPEPNATVAAYFADTFRETQSVREAARTCDDYYLAGRIRELIAGAEPMLEAGCGDGKWVAWAEMNGCRAIGVDWSEELMRRAAEEVPEATFLQGDLRALPLEDGSVGSIISLGAVEHVSEGPEGALREFVRVLRPGGRAIVTVPYLGSVRRAVWKVQRPIHTSSLLRRALRRSRGTKRLRRKEIPTRPGWTADYLATEDGWTFYQYQLPKKTMRPLLEGAGFVVEDEYVIGPEEGIVQTFNLLAGRYKAGTAILNPFGKLLRRILPEGSYEHMLGYTVRKPAAAAPAT